MRKRGITAMIVTSFMLTAGCAGSGATTGTYIATDDNAALMVEIQTGKDSEVSGAITLVGVDPRGALISGKRPFSGTIQGDTLNLNIENGLGLTIATGTKIDEGLDLTLLHDGTSERYTFKRQQPDQFPKIVADFRVRAASQKQAVQQASLDVIKQKALVGYQDRINSIAAEVTKGADSITDATSRVNSAAQSYLPVSIKVSRLRSVEKATSSRFGSDDYRVGQLSLTREQESDSAKTNHEAVSGLVARLHEATARHETDAATANELCRGNTWLDCHILIAAMNAYRLNAREFFDSVAKETTAFEREKPYL